MKFKQVKRGRVSDSVLEQIKQSIIKGDYRSGDKLPPEKELMEVFNVSRGSLREALRSLEESGFVVVRPGAAGGAYVAGAGVRSLANRLHDIILMERVSFEEILQFRSLTEPGIARLAAENRTEEDVALLEEMNRVREKAITAGKIPIIVTIDFHQALAKASKNKMISLLIDAVALLFNNEFRKMSLSIEDHRAILEAHKRLTRHIKNREPEKAAKVMYEHTLDVNKRLKA
ncbi:MAG TPA: FadR/GntR family transcriptional regulator [Syntrophorhabdales bacterium]|nr:FadR/GntR family transcriptional regulator [Syntrophorhabdales bacterium]